MGTECWVRPLPELGPSLADHVALDTLCSLLADADFTLHQEAIDRDIAQTIG